MRSSSPPISISESVYTRQKILPANAYKNLDTLVIVRNNQIMATTKEETRTYPLPGTPGDFRVALTICSRCGLPVPMPRCAADNFPAEHRVCAEGNLPPRRPSAGRMVA